MRWPCAATPSYHPVLRNGSMIMTRLAGRHMTTLEANTDAKAQEEAAESVYADQAQFENMIDDAAEHLSRGHWRRREREILAVGGVFLILLALVGRKRKGRSGGVRGAFHK